VPSSDQLFRIIELTHKAFHQKTLPNYVISFFNTKQGSVLHILRQAQEAAITTDSHLALINCAARLTPFCPSNRVIRNEAFTNIFISLTKLEKGQDIDSAFKTLKPLFLDSTQKRDEFNRNFTSAIKANILTLSYAQIANLSSLCQRLSIRFDEGVKSNIRNRIIQLISELTTEQLASTLRLFSRFDISLSKNFINTWCENAIPKLSSEQFAEVNRTLIESSRKSPEKLADALNFYTYASRNTQASETLWFGIKKIVIANLTDDTVMSKFGEIAFYTIANLSSNNLVKIITGEITSLIHPWNSESLDAFREKFEELLINRAKYFNLTQLNNVMSAMSRFDIGFSAQWYEPLMECISANLKKQEVVTQEELIYILHNHNMYQIQPSKEFILLWHKRALPLADSFDLQSVLYALEYFVSDNLYIGKAFTDRLQNLISHPDANTHIEDTIRTLRVTAALGLELEADFIMALALEILNKAAGMSAGQATTAMHSLAIHYAIFTDTPDVAGDIIDAYKAVDASLRTHLEGGIKLNDNARHRLALAELTFIGKTNYEQPAQEAHRPSHLEREVYKLLKQAVPDNCKIETEVWVKKTLSPMDIRLEYRRNYVHIQIDGPKHFINEIDGKFMGYNGSSTLQNHLALRDNLRFTRIIVPEATGGENDLRAQLKRILTEWKIPINEKSLEPLK
jgi:hypothetical protein